MLFHTVMVYTDKNSDSVSLHCQSVTPDEIKVMIPESCKPAFTNIAYANIACDVDSDKPDCVNVNMIVDFGKCNIFITGEENAANWKNAKFQKEFCDILRHYDGNDDVITAKLGGLTIKFDKSIRTYASDIIDIWDLMTQSNETQTEFDRAVLSALEPYAAKACELKTA